MREVDIVIVGTGPAGAFFLRRLLDDPSFTGNVLVLERGARVSHRAQLDGGRARLNAQAAESFDNRTPEKPWPFIAALGGGSNCWVGNTPRMLPNDFRLQSLYGVGVDWPVSYDELEPYYCDAEEIMSVAGPSGDSPFRRSRPYPHEPHRFSEVDLALKRRNPGQFFVIPAARPTRPTSSRAGCCGNTPCTLCPIDAKFTVLNEMSALFEDPRVTLLSSARALRLLRDGRGVHGVEYLDQSGEPTRAVSRMVALCANAIFNPLILMESGFEHPEIGKGLMEQCSLLFELNLDGLDNFQGSTSHTGHGYMIYDGQHRRERAAALIETSNHPFIRAEQGKWRQHASIKFIFEDVRAPGNTVARGAEPGRPVVTYRGVSSYTLNAMSWARQHYTTVLDGLPIEGVPTIREIATESHIMGTTPMAATADAGPVDKWGRMFEAPNVFVLGSSVFPTAAPANPTLTIAAHALLAADKARETLR